MKKTPFILAINLFWITLGLAIALSSLKESILFSQKARQNIQYFFPQGWAFFTKSPKESLVDVYRVNGSQLEPVEITNVMPENMFGLSRKARIMGYELSMIVSTFQPSAWKENKLASLEEHTGDTAFKVKTKAAYKYFNSGTYLFRQRNPVPWAWAGLSQEQYTPYKTLKVQIN